MINRPRHCSICASNLTTDEMRGAGYCRRCVEALSPGQRAQIEDLKGPLRQAGRPPLPPDQRRDHTLRVRCDDALADAVEEAARAEGLTVGAWIRLTLERAIKR